MQRETSKPLQWLVVWTGGTGRRGVQGTGGCTEVGNVVIRLFLALRVVQLAAALIPRISAKT